MESSPDSSSLVAELTAAQRQLWLHEQLFPGTTVYVVPLGLELRGRLDPAALADALRDVAQRHQALRACFFEIDGRPHQRIAPRVEAGLRITDLCHLAEPARAAALEERCEAVQRRPLPLREGPPFRFELVRMAAEHHVLLGAVHHLVFDARSLEVLVDELLAAYAGRVRGEPSPLPPVTADWLDYVRDGAKPSAALDEQRAVWMRRLSAALPGFELFADHARPDLPDFAGSWCSVPLEASLVAAVTAFARSRRTTPYTVVLAALLATLARYTGCADQLVGTPLLGRTSSRWRSTLGLFVNTLPLRLEVEGTFAELVARAHERVREAQANQDLPVAELIRALRLPREPGRSPLHRALFTHQRSRSLPSPPGLDVRRWSVAPRTAKFDASFTYVEHEQEHGGELTTDFQTALFTPGTIEGLLRHVKGLLAAGLERPDVPVARLPLVGEDEGRALQIESAAPPSPFPPVTGAHRRFEQRAACEPGALAVSVHATGERIDYAGLEARANRIAHWLAAEGVGPDVVVGVRLDKGIDFVATALGVMKAGGCYLPLDPGLPPARERAMLETAAAARLVTTAAHVREGDGPSLVLDGAGREALERLPSTPLRREGSADDLVNILFTSGSTGRPKAVALPHRGMLRFVEGANFHRIGPGDVVLQVSPIHFDGHTFEVFAALANGAALVIVSKDELLDPSVLRAVVAEHRVNVLVITTPLLNRIVEACPEVLTGMKTVIFGGELVSMPHIARALERCGPNVLVHTYGPTECSFTAFFHPIAAVEPGRWTIPIGRPVSHTELYVLDEALDLVPHGMVGDIYLSGPGLAREYLGDPERTAAAFVPNPFAHDAHTRRMYRTGDRGRRRDDGLVEFVGRRDHQIKIRGQRVELGEVEAVLRELEGVESAYVIAFERAGSKRLAAYVVPVGGGALDEATLRRRLGERLPEVMVPERFVLLDALPLRANGKVDRERLPDPRALAASASPGPASEPSERERGLLALWRELLEIPSVDPDESFFAAGGDSLLLMRMQVEIERRFSVSLGITELFAHPTVRALAARIGRARGDDVAAPSLPSSPSSSPSPGLVLRRSPPELEPIAVVGLGLRLPGAADGEALLERLRRGTESIARFDLDAVDPAYREAFSRADRPWVGAEGVLEGTSDLDPELLGIPRMEFQRMEIQHRVFAECVWQALEDAGLRDDVAGRRVAVYAGCSPRRIEGRSQALDGAHALGAALGRDPTFLATRVSHRLDLRGESIVVDTACSTALVAVHLAMHALRRGDCDYALAGAVSVQSPQGLGYLHYPSYIFSAHGRCRPFDAAADGTVPGSGGGVFLLRRLADAERDGDPVHALLLGSALDNDGRDKVGYTAPSQSGQAAVIRAALASAGRRAHELGYIEAHGTGTALGDPIEVAALHEVLAAEPSRSLRCGLGSIKSNMGHLGPAAGVAGLAKAILSVEHGELFPSLHFEAPNPAIRFERGLFVPTTLQRWEAGTQPRVAGVSAFGIGGTNAHVIVGEAGR